MEYGRILVYVAPLVIVDTVTTPDVTNAAERARRRQDRNTPELEKLRPLPTTEADARNDDDDRPRARARGRVPMRIVVRSSNRPRRGSVVGPVPAVCHFIFFSLRVNPSPE